MFDHVNPTTGKLQRTFPLAGPSEVDSAVDAARAALPAWRGLAPADRRRALLRLADLIRAYGEELITISMLECGIPSTPARAAITAEWVEHAAGWAERVLRGRHPDRPCAVRLHDARAGVGVVVAVLLHVECPAQRPRADGRAAARRRLHGRAQAVGARAVHSAPVRRALSRGRDPSRRCQRSRGWRRPHRGRAGRPTQTLRRSASPAAAAQHRRSPQRARARSSPPCSSWAASRRTSSSATRTSTAHWRRRWSPPLAATRFHVPGCSSRGPSTTSSSRELRPPPERSGSEIPLLRRPRWDP